MQSWTGSPLGHGRKQDVFEEGTDVERRVHKSLIISTAFIFFSCHNTANLFEHKKDQKPEI